MKRELLQERINLLKLLVEDMQSLGINATFNEETGEIEVDADAKEAE